MKLIDQQIQKVHNAFVNAYRIQKNYYIQERKWDMLGLKCNYFFRSPIPFYKKAWEYWDNQKKELTKCFSEYSKNIT